MSWRGWLRIRKGRLQAPLDAAGCGQTSSHVNPVASARRRPTTGRRCEKPGPFPSPPPATPMRATSPSSSSRRRIPPGSTPPRRRPTRVATLASSWSSVFVPPTRSSCDPDGWVTWGPRRRPLTRRRVSWRWPTSQGQPTAIAYMRRTLCNLDAIWTGLPISVG